MMTGPVARAIFALRRIEECKHRDQAIAVLEAIENPMPEMIEAAQKEFKKWGDATGVAISNSLIEDMWRAMIAAMLK